ncbi:MAG: hypothetical protein Q7R33_02845 [Nitrosarchaeum sp.]|nr:hypothetical protein [Nitrosarchaeum sp.]
MGYAILGPNSITCFRGSKSRKFTVRNIKTAEEFETTTTKNNFDEYKSDPERSIEVVTKEGIKKNFQIGFLEWVK